MAKKGKIKRYYQLYEYFEANPEDYLLRKFTSGNKPAMWVSLKGPSGKVLSVVKTEPTNHEQLCRYIFKDIEVSRPELTIDGDTIKALVKTLLLDPNIFEYPPT